MTIRPIDAKAPEGLDRRLEHMVYSHLTQSSGLDDERERAGDIDEAIEREWLADHDRHVWENEGGMYA